MKPKLSKADVKILAFIRGRARAKDADPSVKADPMYWLNRIKDTGGLSATSKALWRERMKLGGSPSVTAGSRPMPIDYVERCPSCGRVFSVLVKS
jgi:hypothetical protein